MIPIKCLQFGRIHIFAGGGDDNILAMPGDIEVSLRIHEPDVSRVEPSIADSFRGSVRVLVVTLHCARALGDNLSDAVAVRRVDVEFHAFHRLSDRAALAFQIRIDAEDRGCLCHAVALVEGESKLLKPVVDCVGEGGTAADKHANVPAHHEACLLSQSLPRRFGARCLPFDSALEHLKEAWHTDEGGNFRFSHRLEERGRPERVDVNRRGAAVKCHQQTARETQGVV